MDLSAKENWPRLLPNPRNRIALEKALKTEGISEDDILNAKSEISGLAVKKVSPGQVPFDVLKKIPEEAARHYRFVPLGAKDGFLKSASWTRPTLNPKGLCNLSFPE